MPLLRKLVFYLFLAIYGVICPMLILRLLGFVFDHSTQHWVKTGIIYASTNPPDAEVFINGQMIPEQTPTVIRDLKPGNYNVSMRLAGYSHWESTVPVVDKKATSIENILLIPTIWDIKITHPNTISNIVGTPGGNFLLTVNNDHVSSMLLFRLNDSEGPEYIFPKESIYHGGRLIRSYTVPQSPFLVLQIDLDNKTKYLWIDTRDKIVHIEDISDLISATPQKLYWEPTDEKTLYVFYPDLVNRINIKAKAIYPNIDGKLNPAPKKKTTLENMPQADQIFMINNENTLLYRKGTDIFLMDALPLTQARLTKIFSVLPSSDVFFYERNGRMYYIDSQTRKLSSVTILYHKPFIPKPIAETLRLKKMDE